MTRIILPSASWSDQPPTDQRTRMPITSINSDDVIYYCDRFDSDQLDRIATQFGAPGAVICDVECSLLPTAAPCYFLPDVGIGMIYFIRDLRQYLDDDQPVTKQCFNFSVSRSTLSRHVILKILEWFQFRSVMHSWSGMRNSFNMAPIISEMEQITAPWLDHSFRKHLLSPLEGIEKRWYDLRGYTGPQSDITTGGEVNNIWFSVKREHSMYTATSLLIEGVTDIQPNYMFTEKTIMAIMGYNFLIWPGNYGQAQKAKEMGIDIFEDLIDHSYQYRSTILERCYHAIADNLKLLSDIDYVTALRTQHLGRLVANRQYLMFDEMQPWLTKNRQSMPALVHHVLDKKLLFDQSQ